jgi:DNA-binding NtrC family response regulator
VSRSILLVDDDVEVLGVLSTGLERTGWRVTSAAEARAAMALYERERPDLVLLDIGLPGLSGLQLLEVLRATDPDATVIMLTDQEHIATALEAMRLGAETFLTKPIDPAHLEAAAERAHEKADLRRCNRCLAEQQADPNGIAALGTTPLMRALAKQVEIVAASDATILITGEHGTGKGWLAQLLHALSSRASRPFIQLNSAGLSTSTLASEIFGHEPGAFAGAGEQKRGLAEVAHTGTFFLDAVGDFAVDLQPRLLELLDSRRSRRLGGTRDIEVDFRLIAATHRDLERAVRDGTFGEDLCHRLSALPLRLPPVRERGRDEVAALAVRLLLDLRRRLGRGPDRFSAEAMTRISDYAWPGNIREMRNVIERGLLLAGAASTLDVVHLPPEIGAPPGPAPTADADLPLAEVERRHIARALAHHRGNRSRTARSLGVSRTTLYEKLSRYDLDEVGRRDSAD